MQHNHPKYLSIEEFTYELPENRIAHFPKEVRDSSKLLVYDSGAISEDIFHNLPEHIPGGALMVFNQTRVVQVRLLFQKVTGAMIEIFCLEPDIRYPDMQTAMTQCGEVYWQCLVGGANKWKKDTVLSLYDETLKLTVEARVEAKLDGVFLIRLQWDNTQLSFAEVLHATGKVPLPPYMNREMKEEDKERYQTVYAREEGSVAAPTAGLHFTPGLLHQFAGKKIDTAFLTLHVGAGTFKQVKTERLEEHQMHAEWIEVSLSFLERLYQNECITVSVGTTSMRTLESLYWIGLKLYLNVAVDWEGIAVAQWDPYELPDAITAKVALEQIMNWMKQGGIEKLVTRTQILIAPGYRPKITDQLITNFHQPGSTLLLLVAALAGRDWERIYAYALAHDFRFLSYGDGCLIKFQAEKKPLQ